MPQYPIARLSDDFPTLRTLGFATQYFPRYVNTRLRLHAVDVVLISVILRGAGRHVMGDRVYQERQGSVGITHYGQVHDILTTRRGMEIFNVYLDLRNHTLPVMPQELQSVLPTILPLHPSLGNRLTRSVHFHVRYPERLGELLARIERELRLKQPGHEEIARMCLRMFLIECCREARHSGIELSPSSQQHYPTWLDRLRRHLDTQYASTLSLDDMADEARVSKGHLCRLFKVYTGKTVFEYLIGKRIGAAMLHLRGSDEKILAIALACGFNDIAYFNRTFKRLVGQTPRGYRGHVSP